MKIKKMKKRLKLIKKKIKMKKKKIKKKIKKRKKDLTKQLDLLIYIIFYEVYLPFSYFIPFLIFFILF